jgi:hypothetical protein
MLSHKTKTEGKEKNKQNPKMNKLPLSINEIAKLARKKTTKKCKNVALNRPQNDICLQCELKQEGKVFELSWKCACQATQIFHCSAQVHK